MNILIIGYSGFIGKNYINYISNLKHNLVLIGRKKQRNLDKKIKFIRHDFSKSHLNLKIEINFDIVYFLIGNHKTKNSNILYNSNFLTLNNVFNSKNLKFRKFVYISSHKIYGNINSLNINERCKFKKTEDYYSNLKIDAEKLINKFYNKNKSISFIILRYCGFVEKGGYVEYLIKRISSNKKIIILNKGKNIRDYLCIPNSNKALLNCLKFNKKGLNIFNIGSNEKVTNLELAKLLIKKFNSSSKIEITSEKNYLNNFVFDISKSIKDLKYKPIKISKYLKNYL